MNRRDFLKSTPIIIIPLVPKTNHYVIHEFYVKEKLLTDTYINHKLVLEAVDWNKATEFISKNIKLWDTYQEKYKTRDSDIWSGYTYLQEKYKTELFDKGLYYG